MLLASYEGQAVALQEVGVSRQVQAHRGAWPGLWGDAGPRSVSKRGHQKVRAARGKAADPRGPHVTNPLSWLPVHFRYVVFHPFLDEILIGKIKGCSPEGVHGNAGPESSEGPWEHGRDRWPGQPASR